LKADGGSTRFCSRASFSSCHFLRGQNRLVAKVGCLHLIRNFELAEEMRASSEKEKVCALCEFSNLTVVDRAWLSSEVLIPFFSLTAFEIYTINHETEQFCEICCCLSVYVDAFMLRFSLVSILRMLLTSSECVSSQICCCQQCRRPVTKSNHQIALLRRFPVFRLCCCRTRFLLH